MGRAHKTRKLAATISSNKNVGVSKPEMGVNQWLSMPRDILNRIFSFLNPEEMVLLVPLVCKDWGKIVLERLFCKQDINSLNFQPLGFEPFYIFFYKLGDDNSSAQKLMSLIVAVMHAFALDGHTDDADDWVTPIRDITFPPNLPSFYDRHLVYLAKRCPELEHLDLPCTRNFSGKGISRATKYWSQMKSMFYGPSTWESQHVIDRHLSRTVEEFGINCKNLDTLALGGFHFHWQSSALIARNLKSLKILELMGAVISKYGLQIFLSRCKKLFVLYISDCVSTNGDAINHAREFKIISHQEGRRITWSTIYTLIKLGNVTPLRSSSI